MESHLVLWLLVFLLGAPISPAAGWIAARAVRDGLRRRMRVLPSLPSYVEAVEVSDAARDAVRFHAAVHDVAMTVTEAWNAAGARLHRPSIEQVIDRERLAAHSRALSSSASALRERFGPLFVQVEATRDALREVWVHGTHHTYDSVLESTFNPNDQNGTGTLGSSWRETGVGTDQTFTLDEVALARAQAEVAALRRAYGATRLPPPLAEHQLHLPDGPVRVLAERLVRMNVARSANAVSAWDVDRSVNQWLKSAAIDQHLATIRACLDAVDRDADTALDASRSAEPPPTYRTSSPSDDGPPPARAIAALVSSLDEAIKHYRQHMKTLAKSEEIADKLYYWATDTSTVDADRHYLDEAAELYTLVFPRSTLKIRVPPYAAWHIGAGVAVGGVSAGLWLVLAQAFAG